MKVYQKPRPETGVSFLRQVCAAGFLLLLISCVTAPAPIEEYTLARAAMESAKSVEAARHSPGNWHQAEEAYRKARLLMEEREHVAAKAEFLKAKLAAEKAENSARLIRLKSGEVL